MDAILEEGLTVVSNAVQKDKEGSVEEAIGLYERAISLLQQVSKAEKDQQRITLLNQKIDEYKKRVEILTTQMEVTNDHVTPPNLYPSFTNNKSSNNLHMVFPSSDNKHTITLSSSIGSSPSTQQHDINNNNLHNSIIASSSTTSTLPPPFTLSKAESLQIGIELARKAVEEDELKNYANAFMFYKKSLDYFLQAMKEEYNIDLKQRIQDQMKRYLERAEQIQPFVDNNTIATTTTTVEQTTTTQINVICCEFCNKPLGITENYKIYQEKAYHYSCVDKAAGLTREEVKSFITSRGTLTLKATIPKRAYKLGESFTINITVNNQSNKKVNSLYVYVLKTETMMQLITNNHGIERKPKSKESKEDGRQYYGHNSQFPMEIGTVELQAKYIIPSHLEWSENNGNFARDYDLIVKCDLPMPHGYLKTSFPIQIIK